MAGVLVAEAECGSEAEEGRGLILGEMRGRRAGEMSVEEVEVLACFREPPRPLGFLLVLVKGVDGVVAAVGGAVAVGPALGGMRGSRAGVERMLPLPEVALAGAMRGVAVVEDGLLGAAASGKCSSSMPIPKPSVIEDTVV